MNGERSGKMLEAVGQAIECLRRGQTVGVVGRPLYALVYAAACAAGLDTRYLKRIEPRATGGHIYWKE